HLWDTASGKSVPLHTDKGYVQPPRFTPDSHRVVAFVDDMLKCWSTADGSLIWTGERARTVDPTSICFAPDGKYILARSSSPDGSPIWWDAETGKLAAAKVKAGRNQSVTAPSDNGQNHIDFGPLPRLPIFSANGRTIVTVREAQKVNVLQGDTGQVRKEIPNIDGVLGLTADGRTLIGWAPGGIPQCWNTETGKALWPEIPDRSHAGNVNRVAISPGGRLLVSVGADGEARIWDIAARQVLSNDSVSPAGPILFSPNGRYLFLCGASDIIQWDAVNDRPIRRLTVTGWAVEQTRGFVGLALSRNQNGVTALANVEKDEWIISVWSVATGEQTLQNKMIVQGNHLAQWPGEALLTQKGEVRDGRSGDVLVTINPPRDDLPLRWCGRSVVAQSAAIA